MSDDNDVRAVQRRTAITLLNKIEATAGSYDSAGPLRELAEAYKAVAEHMPPSGGGRGGVY